MDLILQSLNEKFHRFEYAYISFWGERLKPSGSFFSVVKNLHYSTAFFIYHNSYPFKTKLLQKEKTFKQNPLIHERKS